MTRDTESLRSESLQRVLPARADALPLHGVAASRLIERSAQAGLPPHTLMARAGFAVARLALAIAPHSRRVWVAAGPGNNGGDGLEAALWLHRAGKQVEVTLLGDPERLPPDAAAAFNSAREAGVAISAGLTDSRRPDLSIDALLGLGTSRAPEGEIARAIRQMSVEAGVVLAVDLPSGLHSETGQPLGAEAVKAHHTLSLLTLKPGLFTGEGRDHAGIVWLDRLRVERGETPDALLAGAPIVSLRRHAQHKGSFGDALVVGGAPGMTGAVWLAARAALQAGAGRVYVDPLASHDLALPPADMAELMPRPGMSRDRGALQRCTVICGCGGGTAVEAVLPEVLQHSLRLVLDADALNAVAMNIQLREALADRGAKGHSTVLTPHPLEAARLLGCDTAQVQRDRLQAARRLSEQFEATVVLKGSGSIVATPGMPASINPTGNALLATAGTGDVLAGWTGGLWTQQSPCSEAAAASQAHDVAVSSVWLHGRAADLAADSGRRVPLHASVLMEAMAAALGS
ncbi:MAG TPA: NAD(P)H-hydrate dehydratase [Burkholderiaceae bacterium]|nr:NAD(P)H-hydrate dehydratase [Burkholderiaceae bacterium]